MLFVFLGFWLSYFMAALPGVDRTPSIGGVPAVIHIHASVFIGWFLLYIYQSILVFNKKIKAHRKIGLYGIWLGIGVFISGMLVLFLQQYKLVSDGVKTTTESTFGTIGVWMQLVSFAVFLILAYKKRRSPESHRRYILFATIFLIPAALIRTVNHDFIWYSIGKWSPLIFAFLIIGITMIADYLSMKQIHKVTLIGSALLIIDMALLYMGFA